jgi:hypothetical protein
LRMVDSDGTVAGCFRFADRETRIAQSATRAGAESENELTKTQNQRIIA